jgi:hypothetical protein
MLLAIKSILKCSIFVATLCLGCAVRAAQLPSELTIPTASTIPTKESTNTMLSVRVEGQVVEAEIHETGELLRYAPIFDALKIRHAYDPAMKTLRVNRPYDNATLELVFPEGLVRANGQTIGRLPNSEKEIPAEGWLSPNSISVLSGTNAKKNVDSWQFDLDERLRPDTNLELWINGKRVASSIAPRATGGILLIPLRPISDAVSGRILVDGQTITVTRLQDGVVMSWNAQTGLISANRRPIGIVQPSALVELANLLLPKDVVAALTGTNITLAPGSNRIEANLDDRLLGVTTPSAKVIERARAQPFAVQQTRFLVGTSGFNTLEVRGQTGIYNGQFRIEAPADGRLLGDLDPNPQRVSNLLRPTWLSLQWQSLEGGVGILGDAIAAKRELEGVGVSRWRGFSYQTAMADGVLRLSAGQPFATTKNAATLPSDTKISIVGYPSFMGSVAGLRWYSNDQLREFGLATKQGTTLLGGSETTLSWNETLRWGATKASTTGLINHRWSLYSDLNVGNVKRPDASLGGEGGRIYLALSGQLPRNWNLGAGLQYASATYAGDPTQDSRGKLIRPIDQGSLDFSLSGPISDWLSLGMRTFTRRNGLADPLQSDSVGGGANVGFTIRQWDIGVNTDFSTVSARSQSSAALTNINAPAPLEKTDADRLTLTLDKRFEHLVTSVRMEKTNSRGAIEQRQRAFVATAAMNPWMLSGLRGQTLSFTSAVNASWSRGETLFGESRSSGVTLSASLSFQSGRLFGERLRVSANTGLSRTQTSNTANLRESTQLTLDNLIAGNTQKPLDALSNVSATSNGWYYNLRSQYAIARGLTLEFGINKALGQQTFAYLQLSGLLTGVAQRPNLLPRPRHGVVQGRIFLDKNRNSIEDKDEVGLAAVVVRLGGTPWQLRTDNKGNFTINNVPQGAYFISVDVTSLPIGYRIESKNMPRISVLDQEVTEIAVPIELSGQLRGRLFIDANNNGLADSDETGPVGHTVILIGPTSANSAGMSQETQTTTFGQFLFDGLAIGRYQLKVGEKIIEIELSPDTSFVTRDIAILK